MAELIDTTVQSAHRATASDIMTTSVGPQLNRDYRCPSEHLQWLALGLSCLLTICVATGCRGPRTIKLRTMSAVATAANGARLPNKRSLATRQNPNAVRPSEIATAVAPIPAEFNPTETCCGLAGHLEETTPLNPIPLDTPNPDPIFVEPLTELSIDDVLVPTTE